jgi:hypothetical protein
LYRRSLPLAWSCFVAFAIAAINAVWVDFMTNAQGVLLAGAGIAFMGALTMTFFRAVMNRVTVVSSDLAESRTLVNDLRADLEDLRRRLDDNTLVLSDKVDEWSKVMVYMEESTHVPTPATGLDDPTEPDEEHSCVVFPFRLPSDRDVIVGAATPDPVDQDAITRILAEADAEPEPGAAS